MTNHNEKNMPRIKSFVALFDILGFKDLVNNDRLDDVYKVFINLKNNANEMAGHLEALLKDKMVTILSYSDTFLIYTIDITNMRENKRDKAFHALLAACDSLFVAANENELPIRGAITVGDMIASGDVVIGKPIVEAYEMEKTQEWIGCRISEESINYISAKAFAEHKRTMAIVEYEIPCKDGPVEKMLAFNWTQSHPFQRDGFRILNKRNKGNKVDWAVERKHKNTRDFIDYLKGN